MKLKQLSLFEPIILRRIELVAASPRQAFCRIWLEWIFGSYQVRKESGAGDRILDRRIWPCANRLAADRLFEKYVKTKTNPKRRSPRKYQIVDVL